MLVLLDHPVSADARSLLSRPEVLYRPSLHLGLSAERRAALARDQPDVLLTPCAPDPAEAAAWRSAAGNRPLVVVLISDHPDAAPAGADPREAGGNSLRLELVHCPLATAGEPDAELYARALALGERRRLAARVSPGLTVRLAAVRRAGQASIVLVGAGVVNLVTGLRLRRAGHRVTFYDSAPDPRGAAHWTAYGCSRGGGDARMFTLTEADGYHGTPETGPVPFLRPVKDKGWGLADVARLSAEEFAWVRENTSIPPWLARDFTDDVLSVNLCAQPLWRQLIRDEPALFRDAGLREGILRLYSDPAGMAAHARRQRTLTGHPCEVLTAGQVAERYPALSGAHRGKAFAGGIEVPGFTVQVHRFLGGLVGLAERAGAVFRWERPVAALLPGGAGLPDGLRCGMDAAHGGDGEDVVRADHYVLSPGAYGGDLLRGTSSHGQIHGVAGAWLTLPNTHPELRNSLKLSRAGHTAEDANVTVAEGAGGQSFLVVGSGYGWTGADPRNIDPAQLEALYTAVDDTAAAFFPDAFAQAQRSGLLEASRRYCLRPWTASSLPVFEIGSTARGGLLIVTGGHNTGGFAQAPVIAEAVAAAVRGEDHPMHIGYHPDRLRMFYGQDAE